MTMRRAGILAIIAVLLLGSFAPRATVATAAERAVQEPNDWFRVSAGIEDEWVVAADPARPDTIEVTRRSVTAAVPARSILVLYSRGSRAYDIAITRFLQVTADRNSADRLTIVNIGLDGVRGSSVVSTAERNRYGLVLAMGSEATDWAWKSYRGGRLPVVTICAKDPVLMGQLESHERGSGTNIAFTSLNMPIERQLAYLSELKPGLRNLAVLVDRNNLSARRTQAEPAIRHAAERGIQASEIELHETEHLSDDIAIAIRAAIARMRLTDPGLDASAFWITGSTILIENIATIAAHAGPVPVLSTITDVVRAGDSSATFAVGISFESNAQLAAIYADDIMSGRRKAGELPVGIVQRPDVAISFRRAKAIGLKIPFKLFESATSVFDNDGRAVRANERRQRKE